MGNPWEHFRDKWLWRKHVEEGIRPVSKRGKPSCRYRSVAKEDGRGVAGKRNKEGRRNYSPGQSVEVR